MRNFVNRIVKGALKTRLKNVHYFRDSPIEAQSRWFQRLINKAEDTRWGREHSYASIRHVDQFRQQVPLQTYDQLKPSIIEMVEGQSDVLWPGTVNWFAQSSGTTNDRSKFIPVTQEARQQNHFKGAQDLLTLYCENHPDTRIFSGKGLVLGGSHSVSQLNPSASYGDLSAVLLQNMSLFSRWFRAPRLSTALMEEWEAKIERMVRETVHQNITNLSGVPTWTIVLIKKLFSMNETADLHNIWPDLELYIHGGVNFAPYRSQFEQYTSRPINFLQTYNASEGFFAIQDEKNRNDMLLLTDHGIFYEFVPLSQLERVHPQSHMLDEVETGLDYALVISTNTGLWRYLVGDTVRFTTRSPYRLKVTGRVKHFINAFGEELMIENAEKAITEACRHTGAIVREYTAAPVYLTSHRKGGHEWVIEFERAPQNLEHFCTALDKALQFVNSDYAAKRHKGMALTPPLIHPAPAGTFYKWLKSKNKLGGQHKVPRLANHRQHIDEVLQLIKEKE